MEQVHYFISADMLAQQIDNVREAFWPDDIWASVPPRTRKEMEDTRLQAQVWVVFCLST